MVIIARSVFHKDKKYYPQDFLDECLYKLPILYFDGTGVLKVLMSLYI